MKKWLIAVFLLGVLCASAQPVVAAKMYWNGAVVDTSFVSRADLDGSNVEEVVSCSVACGIGRFAVDTLEQKIYFDVAGEDKISRANLDGSNQEDVLTLGGALPTSMAIDETGRKLYWTFGLGIMRANLDGSSVETVVAGSTASRGLSVDSAGGKMYWTDESPTRLSRANLDGSGLENLIGALPPVVFTSTTLDLDSGTVYWIADSGIRFIDLDGSNADSIPVAFNNPTGIAFEPDSGRLYLTRDIVKSCV